jgi:hypothetical protein
VNLTATLSVLAGVVLALGTVFVTRRRRPATAHQIFAIGLVVAAFLYVVFALAGRAGPGWIGLELVGVGLYGSLAWLGFRRWPWVLALGWAAHVAWDLALHVRGAGAAFTPAWYPWLCLGLDVPVAIGVIAQGRVNESIPRP